MKIHRKARTAEARFYQDKWQFVDETSATYATSDGLALEFDGTINKEGQRHTDFRVKFEVEDIIALSKSLMSSQKRRIAELEASETELDGMVDKLRMIFRRLSDMVDEEAHEAPNQEILLATISSIADYFGDRAGSRNSPPVVPWLRKKRKRFAIKFTRPPKARRIDFTA